MDAALGLKDGMEHVVKFLLTGKEERHAIVMRKADSAVAQRVDYQRIACLRRGRQADDGYKKECKSS
jgi:hypothetical protein